jgi:WD40 repeat protein
MNRRTFQLVLGLVLSGLWPANLPAAEPAAWKEIVVWKGHPQNITALAFSPTGDTLAALNLAGAVKVWDVAGSKEKLVLRNRAAAVALAYAPDGKTLATVSREGILQTWDTANGQERSARRLPLRTSILWGVFAADIKTLATSAAVAGIGGPPGQVLVWDVATGRLRQAIPGHEMYTFHSEFTRDSKTLATSGEQILLDPTSSRSTPQADVKLWDLGTGKLASTLANCGTSRFSPDGKKLAALSWEPKGSGAVGVVRMWDVPSAKPDAVLKGHTDIIAATAFSPDGKRLASASQDTTVKVWEVVSGKEIVTLKGHTAALGAVAFSPDGMLLASGGSDHTVRLWAVPVQAAEKPSP